MQVNVEHLDGLQRRMQVDIPESNIAEQVDERLRSMARTVRVAGFRPGKVPMRVVTQRFGRQVRDEVVGELVRTSFQEAVTSEKLRPAGQPTIDPLQAARGEGLSYTAVFDVMPEIENLVFEGLEIVRPEAEVTDDDVTAMIERLREQRRTWREVQRPAQDKDAVTVACEGSIDGERSEKASSEDLRVEIGAKATIDGFDTGLVGAAAGESRKLALRFPEDYPDEEVAGKPVEFEVEVKKVEEPVAAELDEAFATSFGVKEGGIEALRGEVRKNMERELAEALNVRLRRRVMDAILEANDLEVPGSLVHEEAHRMFHERQRELAQHGIDPERVGLSTEMFQDEAKRGVRLGILLAEIIRKLGIEVEPQRVRERVEAIASTYEQPQEVIAWYYADRRRLSGVESGVLEEMVIDAVMERATVRSETATFDAVTNPAQTTSESAEAAEEA